MRHLGSFLLGTGVGSGGVHWNGQIWRFLPTDFQAKSHNQQRYGKDAVTDDDLTVQDWGVTYDELEPHYDAFDKLCGTSGKAGNLQRPDPARRQPVRRPARRTNTRRRRWRRPTRRRCSARPRPSSATIRSRTRRATCRSAYTNPLGAQLGACTYCGFCEKFGCGNYSKASPQTTILPYLMRKPNFTLKTECEVLKVELTPDGKRATGVTYVDSAGEEFFQPAEMVILSAYILHNVRLLLLSGIGKPYDPKTGEGVVGKNYAYQTMSSVNVFFDDKILNPFIGAGALATVIDDFNGDNFDHSGLGFIGGGYIAGMVTGGRPIEMIYTPDGTPTWGLEWKQAAAQNYLQLVLDQRARLVHEPPRQLPRPRPDLSRRLRPAAAAHDLRLHRQRAQDVGLPDRPRRRGRQGDGPARDQAQPPHRLLERRRPTRPPTTPAARSWATTPADSVVNKYLQSWDVPNVFSLGAGAFPQNAGYNPTGTVAALAYHAAERDQERST